MPLLELESLQVRFPVERGFFGRGTRVVHAVEDVSLTVVAGEAVGLVARADAGKPRWDAPCSV